MTDSDEKSNGVKNSIYFYLFVLIVLSLLLPLTFGISYQLDQRDHPINVPIQDSDVLTAAEKTKYGIIVSFNHSVEKPTVVEVTDEENTVLTKMVSYQPYGSITFTPEPYKPNSKNNTTYFVKFIQANTNEVKHNETIHV